MRGKLILRSIVFLLLLCVFFIGIGYLVHPKNNTEEAGIHEVRASGLFGEPEQTIDVLIIGDSESFSAISPLELWAEHGFTSYVFGTVGQYLDDTWFYLSKIFKTQSPKLVILETNNIYRETSISNYLSTKAELFFPIFQYHDRWKTLNANDFGGTIHYTQKEHYKGFQYSNAVSAASSDEYMIPTDAVCEVSLLNKFILSEIQSLCKKNGAELILVSVPSSLNWNYCRHNGITHFAKEKGLIYIDMNLEKENVAIDWTTDTRDAGDHVNYAGASKVTSYLGSYLKEHYRLPDHRNETAYKEWNESLIRYREETGYNDTITSPQNGV